MQHMARQSSQTRGQHDPVATEPVSACPIQRVMPGPLRWHVRRHGMARFFPHARHRLALLYTR